MQSLLSLALPLMISVTGAYLLVRLRAFFYLHPIRTLRAMLSGESRAASLSALALALSGTLGVGNITGVALALAAGGAGAIFWMWVSALLAMPVRYAEVALALDGHSRGGILHPLCLMLLAPVLGGALQSAAAAEALKSSVSLPPPLTALLFTVALAPVLIGGSRRICRAACMLIPPLSLAYILLCLAVIFAYAARIPETLALILREAFSPSAVGGGVLGSLAVGFSRGLLSNEAGCGTAPYAHAEASGVSPAKQGLYGIAEVGIDTLVFCTLTAFAILLPSGAGDGTLAPLLDTVSTLLGRGAPAVLAASLAFFAYATALAFSHYGSRALEGLSGRGADAARPRPAEWAVRIAMLISVALGALLPVAPLASAADVLLAVMTFLTLTRLLRDAPRLSRLTRAFFDGERQKTADKRKP